MMTRIITGAGLLLLLLTVLYFGGWAFAVVWIAAVLIAVAEEFTILTKAEHRPVAWPTWAALIVSIPCFLMLDHVEAISILIAVVTVTFFVVCTVVLFRSNPRLDDMMFSLMPLLTVALPGMCMLAMNRLPMPLHRVLLSLSFFVPTMGDMAAYFVGVRYGRVKLNPVISPKKTIEGAFGGLIGSMLTAAVIYFLAGILGFSQFPFWHFMLIGLVGGLVGQIGDLFASMVKRHCGVKDFGTIFPGHGGMMDRLDSILFVTVFVYIYYLIML